MLELARTFLKPVRPPKVLAFMLEFGNLPSDSDHSDDSNSVTHKMEV